MLDASGRIVAALVLPLALALVAFGGMRAFEGLRQAPLVTFAQADWWRWSGAAPPARIEDWQPLHPDGRAWSRYSQAAMALAHHADDGGARRHRIALATDATATALRLAPLQASTWARASLLATNRGALDEAAVALANSLRLAPNLPGSAWLRARLGLFLWPRLDGAAQQQVAGEFRRVWRAKAGAELAYPRHALAELAVAAGHAATVRAALPGQDRAAFDALLASYPTREKQGDGHG